MRLGVEGRLLVLDVPRLGGLDIVVVVVVRVAICGAVRRVNGRLGIAEFEMEDVP